MVASLVLFHCRNVVRRSGATSISSSSSWSRIPRYGEDAQNMKMRSFSSSQRKPVEEEEIIVEEDRLAGTKLRKTRDGKITELTKSNLSAGFHKKYLPGVWRRWISRIKDFVTQGGNRGPREAILKAAYDDTVGLISSSLLLLYKTGVAGGTELIKGIEGFVHRDKEIVIQFPGVIKNTILITLTIRNVLVIEAIEEDGGGARILQWKLEEDLDFDPALFKAVYVKGDIRILVTRYGIRVPRQIKVIG